MAVTVSPYDHNALRFMNGANAPGDAYIINLYTVLPFIPAATTKAAAEAGATQLATANGYTQNAKALASITFAIAATNGAMFDAADTIWTPTSTDLVANFALMYNDTDANDPPMYHFDFNGAITATFSPLVPFSIIWAATGIARSVPA